MGTQRDLAKMAKSQRGVGSGISGGEVSWKGMVFRKEWSLMRRREPGRRGQGPGKRGIRD